MKIAAAPFVWCLLAPLAVMAQKKPAPQDTEVWAPVPPVVSTLLANAPPSDAKILFNGRDSSQWLSKTGGPCPWKIHWGALQAVAKTGDIHTKESFGDIQLHLEWRTPKKIEKNINVHGNEGERAQHRGNSGVFFMQQYELQVMDSYENPTYVNGQAASIYKQSAPLVNASRPPGVWQTYDVVFIAPRFAEDGGLLKPAHMTAFHNGVLVQNNFELLGPTLYIGQPSYQAHPAKMPLQLQEHGAPVEYRNIWVRELPESAHQ